MTAALETMAEMMGVLARWLFEDAGVGWVFLGRTPRVGKGAGVGRLPRL